MAPGSGGTGSVVGSLDDGRGAIERGDAHARYGADGRDEDSGTAVMWHEDLHMVEIDPLHLGQVQIIQPDSDR